MYGNFHNKQYAVRLQEKSTHQTLEQQTNTRRQQANTAPTRRIKATTTDTHNALEGH